MVTRIVKSVFVTTLVMLLALPAVAKVIRVHEELPFAQSNIFIHGHTAPAPDLPTFMERTELIVGAGSRGGPGGPINWVSLTILVWREHGASPEWNFGFRTGTPDVPLQVGTYYNARPGGFALDPYPTLTVDLGMHIPFDDYSQFHIYNIDFTPDGQLSRFVAGYDVEFSGRRHKGVVDYSLAVPEPSGWGLLAAAGLVAAPLLRRRPAGYRAMTRQG